MNATEIEVGGKYIVRVSKRLTVVEVMGMRVPWRGQIRGRSHQVYDCRNLVTGRHIVVKSSRRFRAEADEAVMKTIRSIDTRDIARILGTMTSVGRAMAAYPPNPERARYGGE